MDKLKKNKEKYILLFLLFSLYMILLFTGCKEGTITLERKNFNVALLANNFNDKSFGELGKKGIEKGEEKLGIKAYYKEVKGEENEIFKDVRKEAEKNDLVIGMGVDLKTPIEKMSKDRRDKNFAIIDVRVEQANVKSIIFKEEEGAFLMGIVAGMESKSNKVGFIGVLDDENIGAFLSGYASGLKGVNKEAYEGIMSLENTRFVDSFQNEEMVFEKASELYEEGCDVVFQCCGSGGIGAIKAGYEKGFKVIGSDMDQGAILKEYDGTIISSLVKRVDKCILKMCEELTEGSFKSGPNNIMEYGIRDGIIDYGESTEKYVNKDTMIKLKEGKKKILDGKITVPNQFFKVVEFRS